jgi:hypothetical protein
MKVPALFKNKYVCYSLMAIATLNIIGYVTVKAWECLALFGLTAYSCHCYCNNLSCSILAALFVANFVFGCGRVKEGIDATLKGPMDHLEDGKASLETAATEFQATAESCMVEGVCDDEGKKAQCDEAAHACFVAAKTLDGVAK